jgi:hypothetical protein
MKVLKYFSLPDCTKSAEGATHVRYKICFGGSYDAGGS